MPSWQQGLTKREIEACKYVGQAFTNRKIATLMKIEEQSVKNLLREASEKLKAAKRVHIALLVHGVKLKQLAR